MFELIKVFFTAEKTKPWLVLLCLFLGTTLEAIGIGAIVPIGNAILGDVSQPKNALEVFINDGLRLLNLEPRLETLLFATFIFLVLRSIFLFVAYMYSGLAVANVVTNMRQRMIKATFNARWNFYAQQHSGDLAARLSGDAQRAGDTYNIAAMTLSYGLQALTYCVIALLVNWKVAMIGFACAGLIMLSTNWLIGLSKSAGRKAQNRTSNLTVELVDLFQNLKPLKAMGRYQPLLDSMAVQIKKIKRNYISLYAAKYGLALSVDLLMIFAIFVGAYGSYKYAKLSLPEISVMGILFYQILIYESRFLRQLQQAISLLGGHQRVTEYIKLAEDALEPSFGTKSPDIQSGCRIEKVSFAYQADDVVKDISMNFDRGQITVLQGVSGSGKTTIIDLLCGLQRPQSGEIFIGDDEIGAIAIKEWRNQIGYVAQNLILFHDTVRENLILSDSRVSEDDIQLALEQANAVEFVNALPEKLETNVGEQGARLSGGQRQRIALARALLKKPSLLILDEVTSALDLESEAEIIENIRALRNQYTIVCITHRAAWTSVADRLYTVSNGKVALAKQKRNKRG